MPPSRWIRAGLGLLLVVVGFFLTLKPFASLDVLTIFVGLCLGLTAASLIESDSDSSQVARRVVAALLIVAALAFVVLRDLSVSSLGLLVGLCLIVYGGVVVAGVRDRVGIARLSETLIGLAAIGIGVFAVFNDNLSTLIIALLLGPALVLIGLERIFRAMRPRSSEPPEEHRYLELAFAVIAVLLACGLLALGHFLHSGGGKIDSFYAAPATLPDKPGELIRQEPFARAVPGEARGWRILYSTTDNDGEIVVASALVVSPHRQVGSPTILWNHGTTGAARKCAPSALDAPFESGAFFLLDRTVDRGWTVVAPDYPGLGTPGVHPYLVGVPNARSGLNAVRAARQLDDSPVGRDVVVWGHSQGGGVALWNGVIGSDYAPDVPVLGVAALAPASDLSTFARQLQESSVGEIIAMYALHGYSATYKDIDEDDYVRAAARSSARATANRCLGPEILATIPAVQSGEPVFSRDLSSGALAARLAENVPKAVPGLATFVAQGESDTLVLPAIQRGYVKKICAGGQPVEFHTYPGRDHVSLVETDSPAVNDLFAWTVGRFDHEPAPQNCQPTR